jgi:arylsulfatase A-like enzyme
MVYGPDIKSGLKLNNVTIYDFVPTVLHLLGLPMLSDMDGRVITEIFKPKSGPTQRKVGRQAAYSSKTAVREKIEQLKTTRRLRRQR